MRILMIGGLVSGEREIQKQLANLLNVPSLRVAELIRSAIEEKNKLALQIKEMIASGQLVDDERLLRLLNDRLKKNDCQGGFVLSGFPKTVPQLELFDSFDKAVCLDIPGEYFVHQFANQHAHGQADLLLQLKESVLLRFRQYNEAVAPFLKALEEQQKLLRVAAADEENVVVERILKQLGK